MDAFEEAYGLLMADDPWLRKILRSAFGGAMPPYREFLGALRMKLYQMKAAGHWAGQEAAALAKTLRAQAERQLRKHPPMEVYGFGSLGVLHCEPLGEDGLLLRVGVHSSTGDDAMGGSLALLPGEGIWFEPVTVDYDDYASAVVAEVRAVLRGAPEEPRAVQAEFHGYDVFYCDGTHVLGVVKTARLALPR